MELLTIKEAATRLKVNKNTVYNLIKAGHIQALKLGALKIVDKELDRFLCSASGNDYSDVNNVKKLN